MWQKAEGSYNHAVDYFPITSRIIPVKPQQYANNYNFIFILYLASFNAMQCLQKQLRSQYHLL